MEEGAGMGLQWTVGLERSVALKLSSWSVDMRLDCLAVVSLDGDVSMFVDFWVIEVGSSEVADVISMRPRK